MELPLPAENVAKLDPLDMLGMGLTRSLQTTIRARAHIEQRWVEDLQQYRGEYDEQTLHVLSQARDRASVFLNVTRPAVHQSVSQLADLLFPAEDKNYGIAPTPVPQVLKDMESDQPELDPMTGEPILNPETGEPIRIKEVAAAAQNMARQKARRMERTIDDQLVECDYAGEARKALKHAAIFGTAVLVGPETDNTPQQRFTTVEDSSGAVITSMVAVPRKRGKARALPLWDFYPDMSASKLGDSEYVFERGYMRRKDLRALAKREGYLTRNIVELLNTNPKTTHYSSEGHVAELRKLTGFSESTYDNHYEVWTYRGPINKEALIEAGIDIDPDDPLTEMDGVVVFSGRFPIRVALNPLESEEWPYSVWCWHEDEFCIFGYGVPWLCRNEQRIINTAWRMMLDNAGKSSGPQIVAKRSAIAPADQTPTITPWKFWWADETVPDVRSAFSAFNFPNNQEAISNVLVMAKQFLSETAGLPPQVGQGNGQVPNTLGGMAMLMNSSNTDRRRQVRDWDDCITKPLITRFYHWNMQYNPDPEIKGDYEVHARGTSALLLREQQAINLMALLDKYAAHPVLAQALKSNDVLRKIVQALHISPEELVKTDDELAAEQATAQEQPEQPDPQIVVEQMRTEQIQLRFDLTSQLEKFKQELEMGNAEADRQLKRELAMLEAQKMDRQLQMEAMRLSQNTNTNYQKILADLKKHRWRLNLDKARFEKELQLKAEKGPQANYGLNDS